MSRHETFVDDPMDDDEGREERTHEGRRDNHGSISGTKFIIGGIAAFFVLCFVVWLVGSKNPETPAGYVGYVTRGAIFGETEFVKIQKGPTSAGRGWLLDVVNVSVTPFTFTEHFDGENAVLTKDNLKVSFQVHTIFKIREDRSQDFFEKYSTLHEGKDPSRVVEIAYDNFAKERLRTYARDEVEKVNAFDLKGQIAAMSERLLASVNALTKDTPFEVASVVVGNMQYPESVSNAVATKMAAQQKLEQMETEVQIENKKAEQRIAEANGIAKAMEIVNQKLTATYLQHEAIEAQKAMVGSPNHTTIYIPVGPMGVPVVGTMNADGSKEQSAEKPDKK